MFVARKNAHRLRRRVLIVVAAILALLLVGQPIASAAVYGIIFSTRFQTDERLLLDVSDYDGLQVEECTFFSDKGQALAGYHYQKEEQSAPLGVVVLSHGMGGGGQNRYMGLANAFVQAGYLVFAYDATGNDNSEGNGVQGMPQGVIDLDHALRYVKSLPIYEGLPIFLVGHSWGAHSATTVLSFHKDVAAVISLAGFNNSEDMIFGHSVKFVGPLINFLLPYVTLQEYFLFGEYAQKTALDGFAASDAMVMVVHSKDDTTVSPKFGYDRYYEEYASSSRFRFVLYEDRGHDGIYYAPGAEEYSAAFLSAYTAYAEAHGGDYSAQRKAAFMEESGMDITKCFEPDPALMKEILLFFQEAAGKDQS